MDAVKTGLLIAQARKEKGLAQRDLAQTLHVSIQAVSKWERGLNFPDIALLEPLAGLLDLTVSELLSGERGRQPQDSLVRELLRVALSQLGRSIQRWRRLFGVALAALAVLALIGGHRLLRDRTDWLPQSETLVAPRELSFVDRVATEPVGKSVAFFDLTIADHVRSFRCQLELWTEAGLVQTWELFHAHVDEGDSFPRHQMLAFGWSSDWSPDLNNGASRIKCNIEMDNLSGVFCSGPQVELSYPGRGFMMNALSRTTAADPDHGVVAACFSLDPSGEGQWRNPDWTGSIASPSLEPGEAVLLLRMIFQ